MPAVSKMQLALVSLLAATLLAGGLLSGRRGAGALLQQDDVQYMRIVRDVRQINQLDGPGARGDGKFLSALGPVLAAEGGQMQQLTDYEIKHAPMGEEQAHVVMRGGELGDEVMDMPIANDLHDDGDMHVPAEYMDSYTFKQRKPLTSQLRSLGKAQAKFQRDQQRFGRTPKTQALRAVIAGPPAIADPSDDAMYQTKLQKLGVNVGSAPSQGGFSSQGDTFIHNDGLEESYSLAPTPQREHNGNTIGGDFFGHVGDMPWTKEQIQAQARRQHTQALAVVPQFSGSSANGWCHCAKTARGQNADCKCYGAQSKKAKTISLTLACCQCGGAMSDAHHPTYVAPAKACALCKSDCSKQAYSPLYNQYGIRDTEDKSGNMQQLHGVRRQREPFFKMHENPGKLNKGMMALNTIIKGSKHFKTPPPTQDVYKVVTKKVIHRDPLVAAS